MKNSDKFKKWILIGAVALVIVVFIVINKLTRETDFHKKYEGYDLSTDVEGLEREGTYDLYLSLHADAAYPTTDITVDPLKYDEATDVSVYSDSEKGDVLYTGDTSTVTYKVNVPEAGFYYINMDYLTTESRGVGAERTILINGELPFDDAQTVIFSRLWMNAGESTFDNQGNEIRPRQIEKYEWQNKYFRDAMGYEVDPYMFYFNKGVNTFTIKTVNEPLVLGTITLKHVEERQTYAEYRATQPDVKNSDTVAKFETVIQGEDSTVRSDASLYPKYDRSSPTTQPYSVTKTVLNYIGGEIWNKPGQFIEWEFEVPEDGYYKITVKGRQNYARGSVSCRSLWIDDEIPFEEAEIMEFAYNNDWDTLTLSDANGDACEIYLEKGKHTVRLEATLGNMGVILKALEDSTYRLNQMFRKLLVYVGATPDIYRDYNIDAVYPEVIDAMDLEAKRLYKLIDDTVEFTGQKAEKIAQAQTLAKMMEKFVKKPYKITQKFTAFKDGITALGTALLQMQETKLDIDYIIVSGAEKKVKKDNTNFFKSAWHEVKSFVSSFFVDYNNVGDVYGDSDDVIKVWIVTGRDQGTILKTMIDDTFTPNTDIKVNVEIVEIGSLLNAVVAGRGPDIVLSVTAQFPVDYALRNAAEDLTQFEGWEDVFDNYYESAYKAYELNGGIYGLPETQTFNVLYYRTDIMEELGLEVPKTWDELIEMLPTIQGDNMEVGIPDPTSATLPDCSILYTLVFQGGSDIYNENGTATIIDNEVGVKAFKTYTEFYNDYGFPVYYDFVSRFRSGQMPIGIANFTMYNTLMVSAPEIKGLWKFAIIPGTERTADDGTTYIDRSNYSTGTCSMMIKSDKNTKEKKQNAWEFLKWWSSADTQVRFGRELEALLGSSARYATANTEAFEEIAWSAEEREVLSEQWASTVGFREIAGGYYTNRHIVNAVRKVINEKEDARETIMSYAITINDEIKKKRKEFDFPTE